MKTTCWILGHYEQHARLTVSVLLSVLILLSLARGVKASDRKPSQKQFQEPTCCEALHMLERITSLDDGGQEIIARNGRVLVLTKAIDEIVTKGLKAIPILIQIMRCEDISFDTFTRCYSACDQILKKDNSAISIYWSGGCELRKTEAGTRLFPGGQEYGHKFRRQVIDSIITNYEAQIKKQKESRDEKTGRKDCRVEGAK